MSGRLHVGQAALAAAAIVITLVGASLWAERSVPAGLLPHGVCFTWLPALLWLHVASDTLIGLAYMSIPITLLYMVTRRADIPFDWMILLFGLFIVSCGLTHWIGIWTIWNPDYWFAGSVKALTAAASVLTAVALLPLVPKVLAMPTGAQLRSANEGLEREMGARQIVEAELRHAHTELERRVAERTEELVQARATAERLRAEAEHANWMKDKFLAKVSHELRTPLQAMLSWTNVLSRQVPPDSPAQVAAARIDHNVGVQARLIDDLLDISRILSGKLMLDLQQVALGQILDRAIAVVQPLADKAGVALELHSEDTATTTVTTDSARLEQVLWNLVSNAIQASASGQRVVVESRMLDNRLVLIVKDDGRGIERADQAGIFEPFQQGKLANSHRGLGLGLAITRSIVLLFGGSIRVDSDGAGRGATFTVELPLTPETPSDEQDVGLSAADLELLARTRVLYVEDNREIADAVAASLREWVLEVDVCYSYNEALATAGVQHDVLICDLHLGERESGHDLLRALRSEERSFRAPALALSAFSSAEDRRSSEAAGFEVHLTKPIAGVHLARAIAKARTGNI